MTTSAYALGNAAGLKKSEKMGIYKKRTLCLYGHTEGKLVGVAKAVAVKPTNIKERKESEIV